eukprot:3832740-Amphidinium_carterae.1
MDDKWVTIAKRILRHSRKLKRRGKETINNIGDKAATREGVHNQLHLVRHLSLTGRGQSSPMSRFVKLVEHASVPYVQLNIHVCQHPLLSMQCWVQRLVMLTLY